MVETQKQLLVVDGNSFAFFNSKDWSITRQKKRVQKFVEAAKNSNFELVFFFEDSPQSEEAVNKWRAKLTENITTSQREVIYGLSEIVAGILEQLDVKYLVCSRIDSNDAVAAYAQKYGGAVLSRDQDFHRYSDRKFKLYGDYKMKEQRLTVNEAQLPQGGLAMDLSVGATTAQNWEQLLSPSFARSIFDQIKAQTEEKDASRRQTLKYGNVTVLTKQNGSTFEKYKELRAAFYWGLGFREPVLEEYPDYDKKEQKVSWTVKELKPAQNDNTQNLGKPKQAFLRFFPNYMEDIQKQSVYDKDQQLTSYQSFHSYFYKFSNIATSESLVDFLVNVQEEPLIKTYLPEDLVDVSLQCTVCSQDFIFTAQDQAFYAKKGFQNPKKCKDCKALQPPKNNSSGSQHGGHHNNNNNNNHHHNNYNNNQQQYQQHNQFQQPHHQGQHQGQQPYRNNSGGNNNNNNQGPRRNDRNQMGGQQQQQHNNQGGEGQQLVCSICSNGFFFSAQEKKFFDEQGFSHPKKCKPCRQQAKQNKKI